MSMHPSGSTGYSERELPGSTVQKHSTYCLIRSGGVISRYAVFIRSKLRFDRDGKMVGGVRLRIDARVLKLDRAAGENPIQVTDDHVGANFSIAQRAAITGLPEARDHRRGAGLGVEI